MKIRTTFAFLGLLVAAPVCAVGCSSEPTDGDHVEEGELRGITSMTELLRQVKPGTAWKDVPGPIKAKLERNAAILFDQVRHDWGTKGLDEKEARVLEAPSNEMTENFDRILKHILAADVADDFVPSKGVKNAELLKQLKRLYIVYCAERRHLLPSTNPDFKDWDGGAVTEFLVRDIKAMDQQKDYARDVESKIKAIKPTQLSDVEKKIVAKVGFVLRQLKYGATGFNSGGDDTRQAGTAAGWLYDVVAFNAQVPGGSKLFKDDDELLLVVNALSYQDLLYVNVGTVDTFIWDHANYVDPSFLESMEFDPAKKEAAKNFVTVANWWKERVQAHKDASSKCTVYSDKQRASIWDAFTADNFSNADGKETMSKYAGAYEATASQRLAEIKKIGSDAVDAAFPNGLTAAQKTQVKQAIAQLTKPALIVETITAALDTATGNATASGTFKTKLEDLTIIGGYSDGEVLRPADTAAVNAMWSDIRAFVAARYAGRPVDVAALLPKTVTVSTGGTPFAGADGAGGAKKITVGLAKPWNKASLYSTLLHEGKHAIDLASKASVLGAAWEGAATVTEAMVATQLVDQVMAAEAAKLPFYRLGKAVDDVRLTATTDATLKVYLRGSCGGNTPDSIKFAEDVVASYGYSDEPTLLLRARRAHMGGQYLSYDYGSVVYRELLAWLQQQINKPNILVEPILLQSCGMPSPNKDAAAVTKLKTCLGI